MSSTAGDNPKTETGRPLTNAAREQDALYQGGKIVARVSDAEVDKDSKQVRFGEVYRSDDLIIPDECEYQKYRILIQRIAYATKVDKGEMHKGRILKGVTGDILGYREQ